MSCHVPGPPAVLSGRCCGWLMLRPWQCWWWYRFRCFHSSKVAFVSLRGGEDVARCGSFRCTTPIAGVGDPIQFSTERTGLPWRVHGSDYSSHLLRDRVARALLERTPTPRASWDDKLVCVFLLLETLGLTHVAPRHIASASNGDDDTSRWQVAGATWGPTGDLRETVLW